MTIRAQIKEYLSNVGPDFVAATASQIVNMISVKDNLSSISSVLRRMVLDEELDVVKNFGPRGGNGYKIKKSKCTKKDYEIAQAIFGDGPR